MKARRRRTRVTVVAIAFMLATAVLWARLVQVQYIRGGAYRALAIEQRVQSRDIMPARGGIFDRSGLPLAVTARTCAVAIKPREVKDSGATERALVEHLGVTRNVAREGVRSRRPYVYVARQRLLEEPARLALRELPGVIVEETTGRVYPYDGLAAKLVGFVGVDNRGVTGIESAMESALCGVPGRERIVKNGTYRRDRYYSHVERPPISGSHVYLTLDVALQEIAEDALNDALESHGARAGAIIVMDVQTGDLLALAERPGVASREAPAPDSLWTIRALSHIYEPGSTFKIVTASTLIERELVTLDEVFDAEQGSAYVGVARIRDPHPHGEITFAEAFQYSSNIVMAKASARIDEEDFYRYVRLFGFGQKTGIRIPGESSGSVPPVNTWSGRTKQTMAFGQEVAVTPFQMLYAMAAIANGGVLMMPRIVRRVVDADGNATDSEPVVVRRVIAPRTAEILRAMCRSVVTDGTGARATVSYLPVSGKTGTAQKAAGGQYLESRYLSSFVGFAPHDQPRIAVLVTVDEARHASRYGGDSAAPAFAAVCRGIANSTAYLDNGLVGERIAVSMPARVSRERAPNFIRMTRSEALEFARRHRASVMCEGGDGRVVSQLPEPGAPVAEDDVIRLILQDIDEKAVRVPDMRGLSMRSALARAREAGVRVTFVGTGMVMQQTPAPGAASGDVRLVCRSGAAAGGAR